MLSKRNQEVVRATAWAFIYVIEHTKTKGGDIKKYAHQVGRPESVAVKKSRHEKCFFVVLFFKSGHGSLF